MLALLQAFVLIPQTQFAWRISLKRWLLLPSLGFERVSIAFRESILTFWRCFNPIRCFYKEQYTRSLSVEKDCHLDTQFELLKDALQHFSLQNTGIFLDLPITQHTPLLSSVSLHPSVNYGTLGVQKCSTHTSVNILAFESWFLSAPRVHLQATRYDCLEETTNFYLGAFVLSQKLSTIIYVTPSTSFWCTAT